MSLRMDNPAEKTSNLALFHAVLHLITSCTKVVAHEIDYARVESGRFSRADSEKLKHMPAGSSCSDYLHGSSVRIARARTKTDPWRTISEHSNEYEKHFDRPRRGACDHAQARWRYSCLTFSSSRPRLPLTTQIPSGRASSSAFNWPRLGGLQLSAERLDARNRGIGGSDANIILSGDPERILRLWREKRGEAEPEDLSDRLAVMLGCWTEEFNRQWYEKLSGKRCPSRLQLTCAKSVAQVHARRRSSRSGAIFEAKHTNASSSPRKCSSATCPSCSTTWRWPGPIGRCCR